MVLDLYKRKVISWQLSNKADRQLVNETTANAYRKRGKPIGLMFHSDQGVQYSSRDVVLELQQLGIIQSMSRSLAQYTAHIMIIA